MRDRSFLRRSVNRRKRDRDFVFQRVRSEISLWHQELAGLRIGLLISVGRKVNIRGGCRSNPVRTTKQFCSSALRDG